MNTISRCAFVAGAALIGLLMTGCENLSVNLPAKRESVATEARMLVYIGTYTHRDSKGIYAFELDLGSIAYCKGLVTKSENPLSPTGTPHAVNEIGNYEGEEAGAVSFRIDRHGTRADQSTVIRVATLSPDLGYQQERWQTTGVAAHACLLMPAAV